MTTRKASSARTRHGAWRVCVGGAPGCGKTALLEQLIPRFIARGANLGVVASGETEGDDAQRLRYSGLILPERVTTRAQVAQHRDRTSPDDAAVRGLERQFAGLQLVFLECSGADWLRPPELQEPDCRVLISDLAGTDELTAADVSQCDLLVINRRKPESPSAEAALLLGRRLAKLGTRRSPLIANFLSGEGIEAVQMKIVGDTLERTARQ